MSCEELRLQVDEHLAGDLPPTVADALRSHLAQCAACQRDAAWADTVRSALARTRPAAPAVDPQELADAILAQTRQPSSKRPGRRRTASPRRARFPWPAALAAAAVMLLGVGLALRLRGEADSRLRANLPDPPSEPPEPGASSQGGGADPDRPAIDARPAADPKGGLADRVTEDLAPREDAEPAPASSRPQGGPGEGAEVDPGSPSDPPAVQLSEEPGAQSGAGGGASEAPGEASRPGSTDTSPATRATIQAALASSVQGAAEVRVKGSGTWEPLRAEARLSAGDRVRTGKGTLALLLSDESLPEDLSVEAGTWVRLPAKAEVLIAPGPADLEITRGSVVVQTQRELQVLAGAARLSLMGCEILLAVTPQGRLDAAVFRGQATVHAGGRSQGLAPGQRVRVDQQGKVGRPREHAKRPRWLLRAPPPGALLWEEPFDDLEGRGYTQYAGACAGGVATATRRGASVRVSFGRSVADGGIYRHQVGARVRVRYRLSGPAALSLQIMNNTQRDNYHAFVTQPQVGAWTELVFRPDAFQDNERKGKRFASGDEVGYVSLIAEGDVTLEVDEVVVYAP